MYFMGWKFASDIEKRIQKLQKKWYSQKPGYLISNTTCYNSV